MTSQRPKASAAELVILDVGHGNASVVHENSVSVLIDAGPRSYVLEYLRQRAITELELVVLSHSDQDHIAGLIGLLGAGISIKSVRLNADSEKNSETWRDLVFSLDDARRAGKLDFNVGLSAGPLPVVGFKSCRSEIVGPSPALAALGAGGSDKSGRKITSNSISACIRVLYNEQPVAILTGDMDLIALDDLLHAKSDLRAPVLVFPHHGGLPGDGDPAEFATKLVAAVMPETVVFSIGRAKHENPRPEIVDAVLRFNTKVHVACTQLSTRCAKTLMPGPHKYLPAVFSAGTSKNSCCAGSVVVDLATSGFVPEAKAAHVIFIKESVPNPLCKLTY